MNIEKCECDRLGYEYRDLLEQLRITHKDLEHYISRCEKAIEYIRSTTFFGLRSGKTFIEWLYYYENATKEDVIQDMILDINSIKEQKQQIQELTNNWNELEEWIMQDVKDEKPDLYFQVLRKIDILDKMKEIKGGNKE